MSNLSFALVLYYSRHGATRELAHQIARGIEESGLEARIRTVSDAPTDQIADDQGTLFVTSDELRQCSALALGSPTRFGHMASQLHQFIETTTSEWLSGSLIDKPAIVFTSSSSLHGGQESTLLSMALPLIHHGMVLCGVPYSTPDLHSTQTGGSPYGSSHVAREHNQKLSDEEQRIARSQGMRLGQISQKLSHG